MDSNKKADNSGAAILIAILWFMIGLALGGGTIAAENAEALLGGFGYFLVRNGWMMIQLFGMAPIVTGAILHVYVLFKGDSYLRVELLPKAYLAVGTGALIVLIASLGSMGLFAGWIA